jgi:hypothetical protein
VEFALKELQLKPDTVLIKEVKQKLVTERRNYNDQAKRQGKRKDIEEVPMPLSSSPPVTEPLQVKELANSKQVISTKLQLEQVTEKRNWLLTGLEDATKKKLKTLHRIDITTVEGMLEALNRRIDDAVIPSNQQEVPPVAPASVSASISAEPPPNISQTPALSPLPPSPSPVAPQTPTSPSPAPTPLHESQRSRKTAATGVTTRNKDANNVKKSGLAGKQPRE